MSSRETRTADPLSRLRIERPAQLPRGWVGRWAGRVAVLVALLAALGGGALWWAQGAPRLDQWLQVPEAIRPRTEVRVGKAVVESGRSADALVVATGYLE